MHQLLTILARTVQMSARHPQATRAIARGLGMWYRRLSPTEKRKVNAILRKGAVKLARLAVGDVIHWAAAEAIAQGLDSNAVQIVEGGVQRITQVGIDRALAELE